MVRCCARIQASKLPAPTRSELITISLLLALALSSLDADLLVILFKRRQIFARFRKLSFLHAFANVPVDKSAFGIHEIKLMIDAREDLSNRRRVADHAYGTHNFSKVTTWHHGWRLVIDSTFKSRWAPVHELNGALRLDGRNGCVHVLWNDIATIHHTARHIFAVTGIAFDIHGSGLEDRHRNLGNGKLLV